MIPTRCAAPASGYRRRSACSATAVWFSTAVRRRASARRSPARAASTGRRRGPAGVVGHVGGRPPASSRGVALARMKSATSRIVVPGPNTAATPSALSGATSSSGMIPPTVTSTSSRPFSRSCAQTLRHERHVGARQDRQADDVDVLLERRRHDHLGRLAEARVDDLEALVAQAAREHLGPAVVPVEPGLGDQDLERSIRHRLPVTVLRCGHGKRLQVAPRRSSARASRVDVASRARRQTTRAQSWQPPDHLCASWPSSYLVGAQQASEAGTRSRSAS